MIVSEESTDLELKEKLIKFNLKFPKYCETYKKLLIEEVALLSEFQNLHYGNCAIIGKIRKNSNGKFLENMRLNFLGTQYSLSEGKVELKILDNLFFGSLPDNKTVELFGKIVLYDNKNLNNNQLPLDAKDINNKLLNYLNKYNSTMGDESNLKKLKIKFNELVKKIYSPAIQIRFFNLIDQHEELIYCNLNLRLHCNDVS